jgi:hypothetical protein
VTHLPLWGTDTKKGILQIEASSTISAGIAAANVFFHCLKQQEVSETMALALGSNEKQVCMGNFLLLISGGLPADCQSINCSSSS